MEEIKEQKCNYCKVVLPIHKFSKNRAEKYFKSCDECRTKQKKAREKNKCEHNRERNKCKECGGSSICEHDKQRSNCKECGGASICEHNKQRNNCKECGGSSVCEHNRRRHQCKECGGASICEHNRIRNRCKECGGASICDHNRIRNTCKECGGASICEHNKQRSQCKECKDPVKITIRNWIRKSRDNDKKYDRYDADHFIDKCFCEGLVEDYPNCYYCSIPVQYIEYQDDLATIERIDNSIGHIKSNCVIACRKCNLSCVGDVRI